MSGTPVAKFVRAPAAGFADRFVAGVVVVVVVFFPVAVISAAVVVMT